MPTLPSLVSPCLKEQNYLFLYGLSKVLLNVLFDDSLA
jgi:hypothetical protein